jgi:hypothetical protein
MRIHIVTASVNPLLNISRMRQQLSNSRQDIRLIVVDEGESGIRRKNLALLSSPASVFYGPRERREWFRARLGSRYRKFLQLIPNSCHAETSFGFLVAWEEGSDVVMELDDDCFPYGDYKLVEDHLESLHGASGATVGSTCGWYNTLENLGIGKTLFPRGHPYEKQARREDYDWTNVGDTCILNMGLWAGVPDLDALTHLHLGGLDGKSRVSNSELKRAKVILDTGTYFAVCSMNTSFKREVIPAFYQLHMNYMGVDRFEDIWSGIFLKKVADHLGERMCLGQPLVYHDKRPRDVFEDLKTELQGMRINEILWKVVAECELEGESYLSSYSSLIGTLMARLNAFRSREQRKFMEFQLNNMRLWVRLTDMLR